MRSNYICYPVTCFFSLSVYRKEFLIEVLRVQLHSFQWWHSEAGTLPRPLSSHFLDHFNVPFSTDWVLVLWLLNSLLTPTLRFLEPFSCKYIKGPKQHEMLAPCLQWVGFILHSPPRDQEGWARTLSEIVLQLVSFSSLFCFQPHLLGHPRNISILNPMHRNSHHTVCLGKMTQDEQCSTHSLPTWLPVNGSVCHFWLFYPRHICAQQSMTESSIALTLATPMSSFGGQISCLAFCCHCLEIKII